MAREKKPGEDETGQNRLPDRAAAEKVTRPVDLRATAVRFEGEELTVDVEGADALVIPAGVPVVVNGVAATNPAMLPAWFAEARKAVSVPGQPARVRLTVGRDDSGTVTSVRLDQ